MAVLPGPRMPESLRRGIVTGVKQTKKENEGLMILLIEFLCRAKKQLEPLRAALVSGQ